MSLPGMTRRELFTRWIDRLSAEPEPLPAPQVAKERLPAFLRPPGAGPEDRFLAACERCGACREACPYEVILPLGPAYGDAAGTPGILPRGGACRLCDGLPCAAACPSGALRPVPREEVRMGTARLLAERCWSVQGQPCDYCVKECPLGPSVLRFEGRRPHVNEQACVGCGMCVYICTAERPALEVRPAASRGPRIPDDLG